MFIECENCQVRPVACGDCVVTALLGVSGSKGVDVGEPELRALDVLAEVGMVAPLRLSRPERQEHPEHPEHLEHREHRKRRSGKRAS